MTQEHPDPTRSHSPDLEIRDPEISPAEVDAIMARIRERIRQRSQAAEQQGHAYLLPDGALSDKRLSRQLYAAIDRLRAAASNVHVHLSVVDGGRQIPVVSQLLHKGRQVIHQLVLYYVGTLAGKQTAFNRAAIEAIGQAATALEKANARIDDLEQEVSALRSQCQATSTLPK